MSSINVVIKQQEVGCTESHRIVLFSAESPITIHYLLLLLRLLLWQPHHNS